MKRLLVSVLAVALPLVAGSIDRTLEFELDELSLATRDGYAVVDLSGCTAPVNPGMPRLPGLVEAVLVPPSAVGVSVRVTAEEWVTVPGTHHVHPSQPDVPLPMPGMTFTPEFHPPDPETYASTRPYPDRAVDLAGSGTMGGHRIVHVEVHPVRYTPATGRLELATRLEYRLVYEAGAAEGVVPTRKQRDAFADILEQQVANPGDVRRFAPRIARAPGLDLPPGDYEYVVVTEPPFDTVFQRLADWKTLKGVPGNVVTVSWIDANYTGYDLPEKIRSFIVDAYNEWGTMYVLLGGSADSKTNGQNIVPHRLAWYTRCGVGSYPDEDSIPCDLYYAGLDGTWDADGDHVYGERSDSADMYGEVFVGRASVYTVAQAQNFVYKTMTYEQLTYASGPPTDYLTKMLLPTAILWSNYEERPMQDSIAERTPWYWVDGKLYERSGTLSRQAVRDSLNAGYGMGNWIGHGNERGIYMSGGPFFNNSDADAMTNGDKLGINASIACFTGAWDETPGGDGFIEHLVNRVGGGLVGSIMNSRYGWGSPPQAGPSEKLDTTFFARVLYGGITETGRALVAAKDAWVPQASSGMMRWCIYQLNLVGDPELPLWTEEPRSLYATHPGVVTIGSSVPYLVRVHDDADEPIRDALVTLWKGDDVYTRGRTATSGAVTLMVSAQSPGEMLLTVDARKYALLYDTVDVISTARYVSYLRSTVLDPPTGGNGDSIINPGETVRLETWVRNWGYETASSVTGVLRTADANVLITDSLKSFGDIPADDSAGTGADGFCLEVDSGLENGYAIACSLTCRDALDSAWVSHFTLHVGTPVLIHEAVTVRDSAQGNNNGRVDPGETADLEVEVANRGLGHGYGVTAVLRSGDNRFHVTDSTAAYGLIRAGDNGANAGDPFTVQADASIPLETRVACTLLLSADGGYQAVDTFTVVVGEIGVSDPIPDGPRQPAGYWAYDDSDIGYEPHPAYDWVEVNGPGTQLNFTHNDAVIAVSLPNMFGPLKYYGDRYDQLSVSADGWLAPGNYTTRHYSNTGLPDGSAPPGVIAPNWDDLYPGEGGQGHVYHYHDEANHRFVIEYDSVAYYEPRSVRDKFEVIIYDTTVTTHSGDNLIVVQYMTANRFTSSTVGLQDPGRTIGIQGLLDGNYHRGCAPIGPQRAICYTTDPPDPTGLAEDGVLPAARSRLSAWPSPFLNSARISWNVLSAGAVSLRIYDAAGREVRNLVDAEMRPGHYSVSWDGRANSGSRVAPGVYFCKLATGSDTERQKLVVAR